MFSFFRNSKNIIDRLKSPQLNNKLNFELSEVYLGYGVEKKRSGNYREALENYYESLGLFPDIDRYSAIGKTLYLMGEFKLAAAYYYWAILAEMEYERKQRSYPDSDFLKVICSLIKQGPGYYDINMMRHFIHALLGDDSILKNLFGKSEFEVFKKKYGLEDVLKSYARERENYKNSIAGKGGGITIVDQAIETLGITIMSQIIINGDNNIFQAGFNGPDKVIVPIHPNGVEIDPNHVRSKYNA